MLIEGVSMADVSMVRESQHSRRAEGTIPTHKCSVGERLYSQGHVCNHARCAANDPDYNVKSAVPQRRFLVAKKHAYGGLEEKGEKTSIGSSNTSSDHQRDRSHALQSLTNSVLTTENGSTGSNGNGKVKSNAVRLSDRPPWQSRRSTMDNSIIGSDTKKVAERKVRSTSSHSSTSTGRGSASSSESHSSAHKSRLSNGGSMPSLTATEQYRQREDSASPASSVTSIRITQFISTRREEKGKGPELVAAFSPTASVGSNHDTEISSLKETVIGEGGIFEQPTANFGELQSPTSESSSSNVLHDNSVNKEAACDSPSLFSPSVDSRAPSSESLTPSTPSVSFASTAPERSSLTTTPVSEISSSSLQKIALAEKKINYDSSSPSVDSRPNASQRLTSSVISTKTGPRSSSTSSARSASRIPFPPSSADRLGRRFINTLQESSKVGSLVSSSSGASYNRPPRISRIPLPPATVDSSRAPTNASRLAKGFITDLQARTVARRSTKGVRSIELRGGKAQSYSTTTVTSWNVTTTTVETSVSRSGITTDTSVDSGLSENGSAEVSSIPEQCSTKESQAAAVGPKASTANPKSLKGELKAPTSEKFAKNTRSFEAVHAEPETVALKHGEVAERRLSEEYMTDHALEGVVKQIAETDHRVKVLVHAFETLATLTEPEIHASEEKTMNAQLFHESLSATTIVV